MRFYKAIFVSFIVVLFSSIRTYADGSTSYPSQISLEDMIQDAKLERSEFNDSRFFLYIENMFPRRIRYSDRQCQDLLPNKIRTEGLTLIKANTDDYNKDQDIVYYIADNENDNDKKSLYPDFEYTDEMSLEKIWNDKNNVFYVKESQTGKKGVVMIEFPEEEIVYGALKAIFPNEQNVKKKRSLFFDSLGLEVGNKKVKLKDKTLKELYKTISETVGPFYINNIKEIRAFFDKIDQYQVYKFQNSANDSDRKDEFDKFMEDWYEQLKVRLRTKEKYRTLEELDFKRNIEFIANRYPSRFAGVKLKEMIPLAYDSIGDLKEVTIIKNNDKYGLYSVNNRMELFPCIYETIDESERHDVFYVKNNGKTGLIDLKYVNKNVQTGDNILSIPCEYDAIENAYGAAIIKNNGKYGLYSVNNNGMELLPCIYETIVFEGNGVFHVKNNGKTGLIDVRYGNKNFQPGDNILNIPCEYDSIGYRNANYPRVIMKNKKKGLYDLSKGVVLPCEYETISLFNSQNGLWLVSKDNNHFGIINLNKDKNIFVLPCEYESIKTERVTDKTWLVFLVNNKKLEGVADLSGKILIDPVYTKISTGHIKDGWGAVTYRFLICYKDSKSFDSYRLNGKKICKKSYESYGEKRDDFMRVWKGNKCGIVRFSTGEEIVPPIYDNWEGLGCNKNLLLSKNTVNGKIMYIFSPNGKLIHQRQFTLSDLSRIWAQRHLGDYLGGAWNEWPTTFFYMY